MFRTVTDGKNGYEYGEWKNFTTAANEAKDLNAQGELTWVEDEFHNRVKM